MASRVMTKQSGLTTSRMTPGLCGETWTAGVGQSSGPSPDQQPGADQDSSEGGNGERPRGYQRDAGEAEEDRLEKGPEGQGGCGVEVAVHVPVAQLVVADGGVAIPAFVGIFAPVHPLGEVWKVRAEMDIMQGEEGRRAKKQPKPQDMHPACRTPGAWTPRIGDKRHGRKRTDSTIEGAPVLRRDTSPWAFRWRSLEDRAHRETTTMTGFGDSLRAERERQSQSLEELCAQTKISERQLQAIEAEHYGELPPGVFRRGMVRAYVTALGLDVDLWMEAFQKSYDQVIGPEPEMSPERWAEFAENVKRGRPSYASRHSLRWLGVLLLLLALCGAGLCGLAFRGAAADALTAEQSCGAPVHALRRKAGKIKGFALPRAACQVSRLSLAAPDGPCTHSFRRKAVWPYAIVSYLPVNQLLKDIRTR